MLLAEAIAERAEILRRNGVLQDQLWRAVQAPEGEKPFLDPYELIEEEDQNLDRLHVLDKQIHETNTKTMLQENQTLLGAVIRLRMILKKKRLYSNVTERVFPRYQYGGSEIKNVTTVNIRNLNNKMDQIEREYQELLILVQKRNWKLQVL